MKTHDEARKLLDAYYEARRDEVECPEWTKPGELRKYEISEKACLDAMTLPAETIAEQQREIDATHGKVSEQKRSLMKREEKIAEQQREIERLRKAVEKFGVHIAPCYNSNPPCTCGLDEVLNESA